MKPTKAPVDRILATAGLVAVASLLGVAAGAAPQGPFLQPIDSLQAFGEIVVTKIVRLGEMGLPWLSEIGLPWLD